MSAEKLVRMANQIATFMESKADRADGRAGFAAHINDYWDPRMREQLLDHIRSGGAGLKPLVLEAADMIRAPAAQDGR